MIKQYLDLFKDPITFLRVEREKNYLRTLIFFLIPFLILFLAEIILTIILQYEMTASNVAFIIIFMVVITFFMTALIFAYSGINHLVARFFKKKIKFLNSFKSAVFGLVNSAPYLFVLMVAGFISLLITENTQNTFYFIINAFLVVVGMTHALVVQILGVMTHHKLSQKHAVISVVSSIFISLVLILVILIVVGFGLYQIQQPEFVMVN